MASGIYANQNHTDMTNHFLAMGVRGGLPLMILFVLMLVAAFRAVGTALGNEEGRTPQRDFLIWTIGATLFGLVMNFWSITLFDQSVSFFYMVLALIGGIQLPLPAAVAYREGFSGGSPIRRAKWPGVVQAAVRNHGSVVVPVGGATTVSSSRSYVNGLRRQPTWVQRAQSARRGGETRWRTAGTSLSRR
jgi:hypothetical protein